MFMEEFVAENTCILSILACIFLTFSYVASLYVWKSSLSRDHPSTIRKRFFSVSCMMLLAPFVTYYFLTKESLSRGDVYAQLGLRWPGFIEAAVYPLLLTAVLFLGPLTMQALSGIWKIYIEPVYWLSSWQDLVWVRNHVMAPLSEEWVFRACMMPLLLQCLDPLTAVFVGPVLFGIEIKTTPYQIMKTYKMYCPSHFHHMFEQMKAGFDFKTAFMISTFQFTYTSLFGAYSAYLFLRTGHFLAPLVAHMFCNHMGFPNFGEILEYPWVQRIVIIFNFLFGFTLWCFILNFATSPDIYDNRLHWKQEFEL